MTRGVGLYTMLFANELQVVANGVIMKNSTPEAFYKHAVNALNIIKNKPINRQILFVRSWNEWGEGNFMEQDLTHGRGFINALRKAIDEYKSK